MVRVARAMSLDAQVFTLTAHRHRNAPRDRPLFRYPNGRPWGTRHIHAGLRSHAPKLACHADRTQTCLPCEFQALATLPTLHPHAHPHRTAHGRVERGLKHTGASFSAHGPTHSPVALSGAQSDRVRCPGGPADAEHPKTITRTCLASSRMLLPGALAPACGAAAAGAPGARRVAAAAALSCICLLGVRAPPEPLTSPAKASGHRHRSKSPHAPSATTRAALCAHRHTGMRALT